MSAVYAHRPDSYTELAYSTASDSAHQGQGLRSAKMFHQVPVAEFSNKPSLDVFLEQVLAPEVSVAYAPAQVLEALALIQQNFIAQAQEQPESALILNRAVRVLADELDMRQLVAMYRGALLQG